jgi:hypothetical protein
VDVEVRIVTAAVLAVDARHEEHDARVARGGLERAERGRDARPFPFDPFRQHGEVLEVERLTHQRVDVAAQTRTETVVVYA